MKRLTSPAMLFAIAALFIGIPGLQRLAKPPPVPRMMVNSFAPINAGDSATVPRPPPVSNALILKPTAVTTQMRSFTPVGPLGAVLFASLPLFALAYAMWPRALGRSLRPDLGRWHAAFAVIPTLLAPGIAFLVFALLSPIAVGAVDRNPNTFSNSMLAWSTTFIESSHGAIALLWLAGLGIFGANAVLTLRGRGESGS